MSPFLSRNGLKFLFFFIILILLFAIAVISIVPLVEWFSYRANVRQWKSASLKHNIPTNSQFQELWSLTAFIGCKTCLVSTERNVYLSGSLKNNSPEFLVSLDLPTGEVKWQKRLQSRQTLEGLDSKYIYVGQAATQKIAGPTQLWGAAQIMAYDIGSRNQIWTQRFAGSRGATINRIIEDLLIVDAGPGFYRVDASTGQKIDGPQQQILLSDEGRIQYLQTYEAGLVLYGINPETEEVIWTHDLSSFPQFLFEDELILIGNAVSGLFGGATALDGRTGKVLWEHGRVISNVAVSDETVYFIKLEPGIWGGGYTLDAQLLAIDIRTGVTLGALHFEPSGIRSGSGHYEYLVAASNDIVLVYLGDGRQLVALRFCANKQNECG